MTWYGISCIKQLKNDEKDETPTFYPLSIAHKSDFCLFDRSGSFVRFIHDALFQALLWALNNRFSCIPTYLADDCTIKVSLSSRIISVQQEIILKANFMIYNVAVTVSHLRLKYELFSNEFL